MNAKKKYIEALKSFQKVAAKNDLSPKGDVEFFAALSLVKVTRNELWHEEHNTQLGAWLGAQSVKLTPFKK